MPHGTSKTLTTTTRQNRNPLHLQESSLNLVLLGLNLFIVPVNTCQGPLEIICSCRGQVECQTTCQLGVVHRISFVSFLDQSSVNNSREESETADFRIFHKVV